MIVTKGEEGGHLWQHDVLLSERGRYGARVGVIESREEEGSHLVREWHILWVD